MGLRNQVHDTTIRDGVRGEAEVVQKELTGKGAHQSESLDRTWRLKLCVTIPDAEAYFVEQTCTIPWDRTPHTGQTVPVTVSRSEPERLRVEWDQAQSLTAAAKHAAALIEAGDLNGAAAAMRVRRFAP